MSVVDIRSGTSTGTNYEQLAEAMAGLWSEPETCGDMTMNRMELQVQNKILSILAGEYPLDGLPVYPTSAATLQSRLNDPTVTADRLYATIIQEPAVALEVIAHVNQGVAPSSRFAVSNLDQALDGANTETLRAHLLALLQRPVMPIKPVYYSLMGRTLWDHARECAWACARLAHEHQVNEADAEFLGLTHDVGKLVIFKLVCTAFRATGASISPRPATLQRLVQRYTNPLSQSVLQSCHAHHSMLEALKDQERTIDPAKMTPLGRNLFLGNILSEALAVMQRQHYPRNTVDRALRQLNLSLERVYEVFPAAPRPVAR
ncbi:MAG: HDOD domain-containing protein [Gammaproteobacteria bacterium]